MIPTETITVRLTTELKKKLTEEAQEMGFSLSEYIRMRLSNADGEYVLRDDGDILLRNSELNSGFLSRLRREARGQLGDKTLKGRILFYLAKGLGIPLRQLRRDIF